MHLKTLTLRGFKSFASTTTLRLEPGITCVVGPNGSGKSNVVDALAWVMGEQGAKTLRGGEMADVIFAGTSRRAALGRAQVDLTIDNGDGALPIDYTEVTISRTLFRGGGSEYSINGTPARLLDIQELLSDTGMGRQMHVIVGQGQLDAILSSTPEERRGFIEEAAGVLKHRRRKERALRKLADMDQNLVRVLDLTNEIHRQLGPLARQAATARRAALVQARVRDAKARLLADDLVDLRGRAEAQAASGRALAARTEELEAKVRSERARLAEVEEAQRRSSPRLEALTSAWRELTTLHERLRGTAMLASDRVASLSRPHTPASTEDPADLDRRALAAAEEDTAASGRVRAAEVALEGVRAAREAAEAADEAASRDLARVNRTLADHRERLARLTGDVSSSRSRLEAAASEAERARTLVAAAQERQTVAEEEASRVGAGAASEGGTVAASGGATSPGPTPAGDEGGRPAAAPSPGGAEGAAAAHRAASARRDRARARVDALLAEEREARAERARWESRRDTLAEGLTPGDATADLLGRRGVLGDVPSLLHVEHGWEDAVAALLAPFADAAVLRDLGGALDQVRAAQSQGSGRVRMLLAGEDAGDAGDPADAGVLPVDEGGVGAAQAGGTPPLPGHAHWALDVVRTDPRLARAAGHLLAGAVVCEDLDEVTDLLGVPGVLTVVTRRGDVAHAWSLAGSGRATSSVLAVHAQHEEAVAGASAALERERVTASALVEANADLDRAVRETTEALRALRAADAERARLAEAAARATSAATAAAGETGRARQTLARAEEQVRWAREQVAQSEERLASARDLAPTEDLPAAQAAADAAQRGAREAREGETAARLALRTEEEHARSAQSRARTLRQDAARARTAREEHARAERVRTQRLARARSVAEGAGAAVEAAAAALARAEEERARAEEERGRSQSAGSQIRARIDDLTSRIGELAGEGHRDEIARAETALRQEQLNARILEELGLEGDQLVEDFGPHNLVPDLGAEVGHEVGAGAGQGQDVVMRPFVREEQERELARATRDLERLGRVNPLALEEHEALSRRHEFLLAQVKDLRSSKADLLTIIDDVDTLVRDAFARAFEDTSSQFAHTFSVLFPGGEGRLVLTDPGDMLSTGIEIEARPAGKKVKRLSLLSGGERSLAALAFLIAIFRARPSPFYVMDEVEAALDDVNLSRLLVIFRELRETSQLIVITHQKRTMEIADALYGVTMREGVTRVVSQRLAS